MNAVQNYIIQMHNDVSSDKRCKKVKSLHVRDTRNLVVQSGTHSYTNVIYIMVLPKVKK